MNENFLIDDMETDADTSVSPNDVSHITGDKNSGAWHRRIPVATYQWLIVVGALGALWTLYFGFRSDMKVNL